MTQQTTQQITLATIQKKLAELQNDIATLIGVVPQTEERITSFTQLRAHDVIRVSGHSERLAPGVYTVLVVEPPEYIGGLSVYIKDEGWVFFDTIAQKTTITRVTK